MKSLKLCLLFSFIIKKKSSTRIIIICLFSYCILLDGKSGEYQEIKGQFPGVKFFSNGSLMLQSVKESEEGYYLCQAMNGIGTAPGKLVHLTVNCKLFIGFNIIIIEWNFIYMKTNYIES